MIILRFGKSGRLAGICETAIRLACPSSLVVSLTREGTFLQDEGRAEYKSFEALLHGNPGEAFMVMDASVDHSSSAALSIHEHFKRDCIAALARQGLLWRCIGFSSGITLIDASRIRQSAAHMIEYRRQKLAQQELFESLGCPVFLPRLFTVVGPRTYAGQNAAWAHIFRARLERSTGIILNEPHSRRAWASEFTVLRCLLGFLADVRPANVNSAIVQGEFTLDEIASSFELPLPAMRYSAGSGEGWLSGDYLPPSPLVDPQTIGVELLRSLNF
jgi:hypothetical protein